MLLNILKYWKLIHSLNTGRHSFYIHPGLEDTFCMKRLIWMRPSLHTSLTKHEKFAAWQKNADLIGCNCSVRNICCSNWIKFYCYWWVFLKDCLYLYMAAFLSHAFIHAHTHTKAGTDRNTGTHTQQGVRVNQGRYMDSGPLPDWEGFRDFTYSFPGLVSPLSPVKKKKKSSKTPVLDI